MSASGAQEVACRAEAPCATRRELSGEARRFLLEGLGGDGARREAGLRGLSARERLARQDPLDGSRFADARREEDRGGRGKTAETDLGKADARLIVGENEVAGGRDFRSPAQAGARYDRHRHGRCLDQGGEQPPHRREHPLDRRGLRNVLSDLDARREGPRQPREYEHPGDARVFDDAGELV